MTRNPEMLLQSQAGDYEMITAADCGRFSICYSKLGIPVFLGGAADCGRFSICYSRLARRP